ncbi:MAG: trigger factor [Myxococcales bacterium]|nr:trigger factor [Myxococcales bacterium]
MNSEINEISSVFVEVKVEIPWERVEKELDESFRQVGRRAKVKGFRPGKVPPKVVRQVYGQQVRGEVANNLMEEGLMFAVRKHELPLVAQPHVHAPTLEDGKPLSFSAKLEVRPKIDKVTTEGLEVEIVGAEVEDGAVDQEIERIRQSHAEVHVPEPMRPAQDSDQLTIDYTVSIDGEPRPEMGATDRTVELGLGQLLEQFEKGLIGTSPGEEKDIEVSFEEEHEREDIRGKKATFHVKVKEVRERVLPDLDDEFAKDLGEYETLLELRLKVREQLEAVAKDRTDAELKEALIDKLIELNPIELPPSLVLQEERQMMYEFLSYMGMMGQQSPPTEDLQKGMHDRAERKVRAGLLLGAIARLEKLEIGEAEVDQKLQEISERTGKHIAKVKAEHAGEKRAMIENQVLEEKLMEHLNSIAKVMKGKGKEASPKAKADDAAKAPKKKAPAKKKASKAKADDEK